MIAHASLAALLARPATIDRQDARRASADLALVATAASVVVLFAISETTLEHFGVHYVDPGGSPLAKFHPATYLAVAAYALRCLANGRPWRHAWRLIGKSFGSAMMLAAIGVAMIFATTIAKIPITPLIDTFALPVLLFLLLRDLDSRIVAWLALLVAALLCVNAVMGIIEFIRGMHFITLDIPAGTSADPSRGDVAFDWRAQLAQEWRAIALLGHPLVDGLIVGCLIMCLAAPGSRWLRWPVKAPILLLQLVSMFAFGARSSLVLSLFLTALLLLQKIVEALKSGQRLTPRTIAWILFVVAVAAVVVGLLIDGGFFDRTIERFADDSGSAGTRLTMFELFHPFSWTELFLGPDPNVLATWQRVEGLEFGVESAWVGLILNYGLIVTAIIVLGLVAFSRSIISAGGRGTTLVLLYYFVSVSVSASLSGKTTTFAMLIVIAMLFLRKDERPRFPRLPSIRT